MGSMRCLVATLLAVGLSSCGAASDPQTEDPGDEAGGSGGTASGGKSADDPSGTGGTPAATGGKTGSGGTPAATGGTPANGGTGGTGGDDGTDVPGAGGSSTLPDAGATPDAEPPTTGTPAGPFDCTLIIGINATSEWYTQGFENLVDNGKWEILRVHSGFVELWADPKNAVWGGSPSSACTKNANNPDRVIFIALNFDTTMLDQWVPPLTNVVKNLKAKYSNLKNIELGTFVRAPGNKPCPQAPAKRSTIAPAEDEAIAMVAAANPGLVTVSPKFEAKTCSEFSGNPPHPSAAGGKAWAAMMAEHYK
jgi:hypothetical protein